MTKQEILNEVINIILKVNRKLNPDTTKITKETEIKSLELNSLSYIRMIVLIENKFNVKIYDDIIQSNNKDSLTIEDLCNCILGLL